MIDYSKYRFVCGIDPGTQTGYAVWERDEKQLDYISSGSLIEVYHWIKDHHRLYPETFIRIEDARQRKWYGKQSNAKAQGAGSIKRDCTIWEEICEYHDWHYEMVHPVKGGTKWDHDTFCNVTGWDGRTNEHQRDAGMLCFDL